MKRLRAVTYARVSSEKEMQAAAFENQILWYEKIKDRMSDRYEFVGHYQDKGITGTAAKKRPGFMKMIDEQKLYFIANVRRVALGVRPQYQ